MGLGLHASQRNRKRTQLRSIDELAELIVSVAEAAQADVILCATDTGALARSLHQRSSRTRVIATTTKEETFAALTGAGITVFRLPVRVAEKYRQVSLIISVAVRAQFVSNGELAVCSIGHELSPEERDLIVLTDVGEGLEAPAVSDLVKLTDGIRPSVLEATVSVAGRIGRAAGRGKRIGAIFMLGDSGRVLEGSRQLIPNPFKGHPQASRMMTTVAIHEAIVELAKLDGAFVIRGDGMIQAAGVFLATEPAEITLPSGLGTRHVAAATTTARTSATAVVVSATDGNIRIFSGGRLMLQIAPDVPYGPVPLDE